MATSTKNVKLGVCRVYYAGVDLGLTKGGVEATVSTETHKTEVDQYGKTVIKEVLMGRNVSVKVPMAETTLQNMASLMPGAALVSDGVKASATLTFTAPVAASTVNVGGQAFTFTAGQGGTYAVKLGATTSETMQNFVSTLNRAGLQKTIGGVVATVSGANTVKLSAIDPGTAANAVTVTAASGITASGATLAGGTAETKARLEVTTGTGIDLLDVAQELRLHPQERADTDFSDDFTIYYAATPGALKFSYKLDAERIFEAEFSGYPSPTTGKLFAIGDPNA